MQHDQQVRYEDVAGVKSRVSWGAVMGGSVVTLASYLLFSLLLAGIGLKISEAGANGSNLGLGTVLVGVFCMGLALFAGGWVTTQLTAGETKCESVVYGILTWATVTAISLYIVGMGVRAGYHGLLDAAYVAQSADPEITKDNWELVARRSGVSLERIKELRSNPNRSVEDVQKAIDDPGNRENARKAIMMSIWTALVGTLLAMGCAIAGALVGSGPEFRLIPASRGVRHQEVVMTK
jgi:hypothetical protein